MIVNIINSFTKISHFYEEKNVYAETKTRLDNKNVEEPECGLHRIPNRFVLF